MVSLAAVEAVQPNHPPVQPQPLSPVTGPGGAQPGPGPRAQIVVPPPDESMVRRDSTQEYALQVRADLDPIAEVEPALIEQGSAQALSAQLEGGEMLVVVMLEHTQHRPATRRLSHLLPSEQTAECHLANGAAGSGTHL